MRKTVQNSRFMASRESFVPVGPPNWIRQESFVPVGLAGGVCRESFVPAPASRAVQSSPCVACYWREREKILPACGKWAKIGVFGRAGRVLYRVGPRGLRAGRVLYRRWFRMRYKVRPARLGGGGSGIKLSLLAQNALKRVFWACRESFVPVSPDGAACWTSFVAGGWPIGVCWANFFAGQQP